MVRERAISLRHDFVTLIYCRQTNFSTKVNDIILTIILLFAAMETTRLSSKGQVIIPKKLRDAYQWLAGQELIAIATDDGILLKPKQPFKETKLAEVAGCLSYEGEAKTVAEMDDAIRQSILKQWQ